VTRKRKRVQAEITSDERGGELEEEDEEDGAALDGQQMDPPRDTPASKRARTRTHGVAPISRDTAEPGNCSPRSQEAGGRAAISSRGRVRNPRPWQPVLTGGRY
jgi:hypothetical protein